TASMPGSGTRASVGFEKRIGSSPTFMGAPKHNSATSTASLTPAASGSTATAEQPVPVRAMRSALQGRPARQRATATDVYFARSAAWRLDYQSGASLVRFTFTSPEARSAVIRQQHGAGQQVARHLDAHCLERVRQSNLSRTEADAVFGGERQRIGRRER